MPEIYTQNALDIQDVESFLNLYVKIKRCVNLQMEKAGNIVEKNIINIFKQPFSS